LIQEKYFRRKLYPVVFLLGRLKLSYCEESGLDNPLRKGSAAEEIPAKKDSQSKASPY